jgi:hypothetical protein
MDERCDYNDQSEVMERIDQLLIRLSEYMTEEEISLLRWATGVK